MPLAILAEYAGGMTNRRRVFLVGTPVGQTASTYPCEIKLDDRAKRLKEHDKIWSEKEAKRAARTKGVRKR